MTRPYIMCEYAHAMGNSSGNFQEYFDFFREAADHFYVCQLFNFF
ncbi:hypothetical protein EEL52_10440 [Muribaculaceae bacterium Isolate-113 (HZI)]|nr:hypothetical protein EEL53_10850 [Muribaculaceae bacterium Isolate-114 (HZI)]ROT20413.1 hypothetical protein EEL52_10440 [Muribaculaceae bacterium Isolate-113 (HZI)]